MHVMPTYMDYMISPLPIRIFQCMVDHSKPAICRAGRCSATEPPSTIGPSSISEPDAVITRPETVRAKR
jgi:hypothetical protein